MCAIGARVEDKQKKWGYKVELQQGHEKTTKVKLPNEKIDSTLFLICQNFFEPVEFSFEKEQKRNTKDACREDKAGARGGGKTRRELSKREANRKR